MQVPSTTRDGVVLVSPAGVIDTRTAQAFEATMLQAFTGGARSFAVDFGRVDLITSAGIRVLVMMAHRLQRGVGGLVLFALTDRVRTVFEIGGLLQQFRIVGTEPQAIDLLKETEAPAAATVRPSRLSELVLDLVCADVVPRDPQSPPAAVSALASAVASAVTNGSAARAARTEST